MTAALKARPLTPAAFAPFGDVLEVSDGAFIEINQGRCRRFHDLAKLDFADGQAGINLFHAQVRTAPYSIELLERHPLGSQCFVPMQGSEYIVAVAPDADGQPGEIQAFLADANQCVNYHRNTWHAVLTPVSGTGLFAVIDRIGQGKNLQEHWFDTPIAVELPAR